MTDHSVINHNAITTQAEVQDQLAGMASWKNSRLMTFDAQNHHVRTHFNDQLVVLLREVGSWWLVSLVLELQ